MESDRPGMATATPPAASRRWGWGRLARIAMVVAGLALGGEVVRVVVGSNFHAVVSGEIYRCSQPSQRQLDSYIRDNGIRTVVNLRGRSDGQDWYETEARVCQAHGVSHENLPLSAARPPSKYEVRRLIEILERAERPILLHCRQGADRTGLAAVAALLLDPKNTYAESRPKLGLRYGHWSWGPTGRLDLFYEQYERWLAGQQATHSAERFRHWATEVYAGNECQYEVVSVDPVDVVKAYRPHAVRVRLRNISPEAWDFSTIGRSGFHLAVMVQNEDPKGISFEDRAGMFDRVVAPGEEIELVAVVRALPPGRYRLRLDMIHQQMAYFAQLGQEPIEKELNVRE